MSKLKHLKDKCLKCAMSKIKDVGKTGIPASQSPLYSDHLDPQITDRSIKILCYPFPSLLRFVGARELME